MFLKKLRRCQHKNVTKLFQSSVTRTHLLHIHLTPQIDIPLNPLDGVT